MQYRVWAFPGGAVAGLCSVVWDAAAEVAAKKLNATINPLSAISFLLEWPPSNAPVSDGF
jgi:hypothetical protein